MKFFIKTKKKLNFIYILKCGNQLMKNKLFKNTFNERFVKVFIWNSSTKQALLLVTYR